MLVHEPFIVSLVESTPESENKLRQEIVRALRRKRIKVAGAKKGSGLLRQAKRILWEDFLDVLLAVGIQRVLVCCFGHKVENFDSDSMKTITDAISKIQDPNSLFDIATELSWGDTVVLAEHKLPKATFGMFHTQAGGFKLSGDDVNCPLILKIKGYPLANPKALTSSDLTRIPRSPTGYRKRVVLLYSVGQEILEMTDDEFYELLRNFRIEITYRVKNLDMARKHFLSITISAKVFLAFLQNPSFRLLDRSEYERYLKAGLETAKIRKLHAISNSVKQISRMRKIGIAQLMNSLGCTSQEILKYRAASKEPTMPENDLAYPNGKKQKLAQRRPPHSGKEANLQANLPSGMLEEMVEKIVWRATPKNKRLFSWVLPTGYVKKNEKAGSKANICKRLFEAHELEWSKHILIKNA